MRSDTCTVLQPNMFRERAETFPLSEITSSWCRYQQAEAETRSVLGEENRAVCDMAQESIPISEVIIRTMGEKKTLGRTLTAFISEPSFVNCETPQRMRLRWILDCSKCRESGGCLPSTLPKSARSTNILPCRSPI